MSDTDFKINLIAILKSQHCKTSVSFQGSFTKFGLLKPRNLVKEEKNDKKDADIS